MFEEYDRPLPDLDAWLARIGLYRRESPCLDYLNRILKAHQLAVPFENLTPYDEGRQVSLEIPALFDKIVKRRRGGYCFELNGLLCRALQDLGFDASSCMVRIVRGKNFIGPIMHRGIIVRLEDGEYYCDVGNGGHQPEGAVLIRDGAESRWKEGFRVRRMNEWWWELAVEGENGWEPYVQFYTMPQHPVDFIALNEKCSGNPASTFVQRHFLHRRTPDGSVFLMNRSFSRVRGGVRSDEELQSVDELRKVLEEDFGLNTEGIPLKL